ncbi:MAG: DUF1499 domain-containing protein [Candidatus Eremiobacteraeota bacterium]|nr:DUF1499 domain-containing protein [Candidatus Eremiobacteraeota bacterium]
MKQLRGTALVVSALAVTLFVLAGPGTRLGLWTFGTGLGMLKWAAYAGIAGVVLTLAALAITRPHGRSLATLVVALVLAGGTVFVPWRALQRARALPPIHDISTDTQDPPAFVAILPLRAGAANPAAYGGDSMAALQHAGYPDLRALHLAMSPGAAYARAVAVARGEGWNIVGADSAAGRVEAVATTRWFGFKDDVVVRLRPEGAGTRVDVRSVSRVGVSDVGTNAARIRDYLGRLAGA